MAGGRLQRFSPTLLVAAMASLGLSPPAVAETVIAQESGFATVSAYGGRLAWSSYRPGTKDYVLKTRFGGVISEVPIVSRLVTFDVDLGPDAQGRTVAVYSRCETEEPFPPAIPPRYHANSGCDIHRYDFETQTESRVVLDRSPRVSEFLPSIWGDRIAFAGRSEAEGVRVYVGQLSNGKTRALRRDPSGWDHPDKVDLRGRRVAYSAESNCYPPDPEGARDSGPLTELWLGTVDGRRQQRVDRGCTWRKKTGVATPTLTSRALYYTLARRTGSSQFDFGVFFARFSLKSRQVGEAPTTPGVGSLSLDQGATYYTRASPQTGLLPIEVVQSDPISYRPRR